MFFARSPVLPQLKRLNTFKLNQLGLFEKESLTFLVRNQAEKLGYCLAMLCGAEMSVWNRSNEAYLFNFPKREDHSQHSGRCLSNQPHFPREYLHVILRLQQFLSNVCLLDSLYFLNLRVFFCCCCFHLILCFKKNYFQFFFLPLGKLDTIFNTSYFKPFYYTLSCIQSGYLERMPTICKAVCFVCEDE